MSFEKFNAQIEASRRFEHEADGAKFRLVLPTDHDVRLAYQATLNPHGHPMEEAASRLLLEKHLIGWAGVVQKHFDPVDGNGEVVAFDETARKALLDSRQDIADELVIALYRKRKERKEAIEAARKNSDGGSNGT